MCEVCLLLRIGYSTPRLLLSQLKRRLRWVIPLYFHLMFSPNSSFFRSDQIRSSNFPSSFIIFLPAPWISILLKRKKEEMSGGSISSISRIFKFHPNLFRLIPTSFPTFLSPSSFFQSHDPFFNAFFSFFNFD